MTVYQQPNKNVIDRNCSVFSTAMYNCTPEEKIALMFSIIGVMSTYFSTAQWVEMIAWTVNELPETLKDETFQNLRKAVMP